jgi:hypothetical protein
VVEADAEENDHQNGDGQHAPDEPGEPALGPLSLGVLTGGLSPGCWLSGRGFEVEPAVLTEPAAGRDGLVTIGTGLHNEAPLQNKLIGKLCGGNTIPPVGRADEARFQQLTQVYYTLNRGKPMSEFDELIDKQALGGVNYVYSKMTNGQF